MAPVIFAPCAHAFADRSLVVPPSTSSELLAGISCAHAFADPPVLNAPEFASPCAYSFALYNDPVTAASVIVAQLFAEPSALWVDVPTAHSFADASSAVEVGVVARVAQSFADPVTVSTPVPPIACALDENSPSATTPVTFVAHSSEVPAEPLASTAESEDSPAFVDAVPAEPLAEDAELAAAATAVSGSSKVKVMFPSPSNFKPLLVLAALFAVIVAAAAAVPEKAVTPVRVSANRIVASEPVSNC